MLNKNIPSQRLLYMLLVLPLQGLAQTQLGVALRANVCLQRECDLLAFDCLVA